MPRTCDGGPGASASSDSGRERETALTVLRGTDGVLEVRPGSSSVLLLLALDADLESICRKLENALPALRPPAHIPENAHRSAPLSCFPEFRHGKGCPCGLNPRKLELRTLLAVYGLSVVLVFTGSKNAHAATGADFRLLTVWHVWTRRNDL
jgi:hypothetical protein